MWFRLNPDLVNDYRAQTLSTKEFRRQVYAALAGETNDVSPFLRPCQGRPSAAEWKRLRESVFARDNYTCQYCSERGVRLECDHVVPIAKGGSSEIENLVTACFPCNRSKRDKTLEDWRGAHGKN